ncbi:MAG: DUF1080 domain-containing protein [Verrucomicrobiota bacterium]
MNLAFFPKHLLFAVSLSLGLTVSSIGADWEVLFDGSSLDGWSQNGNWKIESGALYRESKGGAIRYAAKPIPDDFVLEFEWKVAPRSNSGVYYRPTQYEYQILDNDEHPDGGNPRTSAASLYFCMAPSEDRTKPVGQWNTGRIVAKGSVIQHWLNGEIVIGFDYEDPKWEREVALLAARGGDLNARGAHLSLQDHGDPVWYRSIRLREIPAEEEIETPEVSPAAIAPEILKKEREKLEAILQRREKAKANE